MYVFLDLVLRMAVQLLGGILPGGLKMLSRWHGPSCHKAAREIRGGCHAGPRGVPLAPVLRGWSVFKRVTSSIASVPMVLSVLHPKADPGKRVLDGSQVGLVLIRKEGEKVGCQLRCHISILNFYVTNKTFFYCRILENPEKYRKVK